MESCLDALQHSRQFHGCMHLATTSHSAISSQTHDSPRIILTVVGICDLDGGDGGFGSVLPLLLLKQALC